MLDWVNEGTTLLFTGNLDTDEHWLPVSRSKELGLETSTRPVAPEEFLFIEGIEYQLSYRGEKIQRLEKTIIKSHRRAEVAKIPHGKGQILWAPLPVENSDRMEPLAALYQFALRAADVAPLFSLKPTSTVMLVCPTVFDDAVLYTLVSECDRDTPLTLVHLETKTEIHVNLPAQRSTLIFLNRREGRILSKLS